MYPVAYWIAFRGGRHKSALLLVILLPFFVSFVIRILTWQFILADQGIVLGTLKDIGLLPSGLHVLSTPVAVIAGLTYDALPFMALPIYVALESIDRSLHRGGGGPLREPAAEQFLRVILPLSAPGVYAGILLVAITNIGDYVSAAILGGPNTTMIGNIIQTQYVQNADYPVGVGAGADPDGGPARSGCTCTRAPSALARSRSTSDGGGGHRRSGARPTAGPRRLRRFVLPGYVVLVIAYTLVPIAVMVLYGFNQAPSGRLTFAWKGFTLDWYRHLFDIPDLTARCVHSLEIAALSTLIATAIGIPAALALARYRFRGTRVGDLVILADIAAPSVVVGASLLGLLRLPRRPARLRRRSCIAHVAFNVAFVVVVLQARRRATSTNRWSRRRRTSAPTRWVAFWKVTFPLIFPGHPGGRAAGLRAVDRRLHHHQLRRRPDAHVPALGLRRGQGGHPAAGVRDGDADLPRGRGDRDRKRRGAEAAGASRRVSGKYGGPGREKGRLWTSNRSPMAAIDAY